MKLTDQQSTIVNHVTMDTSSSNLTMVNAVAGSGKTSLLVALTEALVKQAPYTDDINPIKDFNGLYMAYNKSIATEAQQRFPSEIQCSTTHSLAYQHTVKSHGLHVGFFNARDIKESINYDSKVELIDAIQRFCLSEYLSFRQFITDYEMNYQYIEIGNKYLGLMQSGKIACTHDFYLKYFHILLANGNIGFPEWDIIGLDECGDLTSVTLEIFKLLPAKKKLMVGDKFQNIYTFNHTINCFSVMEGKGTTLPMTQSFRVSNHIAKPIESFCKKYLDPTMEFKGIDIADRTVKTNAYISRTNASLVGKMFELNSLGIPYGLARTAKQIFQLPLLLTGLKHRGFIPNPEYKHLQSDIDDWHESVTLRKIYKSPLSYIKAAHTDDVALQVSITLVLTHGSKAINECYQEARKHERGKQDYLLGTAFSMKG